MSRLAALELLLRSELRHARGRPQLVGLAIGAVAISTWMALTLVSGTWMFYLVNLNSYPTKMSEQYALLAGLELGQVADPLSTYSLYFSLAVTACGLVLIPIFNLGAQAATLGARQRLGRLAKLRLMGASTASVIRLDLLRNLLTALIGVLLGSLLWWVSLPGWKYVKFFDEPIRTDLMVLPPSWFFATIGSVIVLNLIATAYTLARLRIDPLGVARHEPAPKLGLWRGLVAVSAALAGGTIALVLTGSVGERLALIATVFIATLIVLVIISLANLQGPLVLQLLTRVWLYSPNPAHVIAARRIIADPRSVWRQVAGICLLTLIATQTLLGLNLVRAYYVTAGASTYLNGVVTTDIFTGVNITLMIALVVGGMNTLTAQTSAIYQRLPTLAALQRIGAPLELWSRVQRFEILWPLLVGILASIGLGLLFVAPFVSSGLRVFTTRNLTYFGGLLLITCLIGVTVSLVASWLQRKLLKQQKV